MPALLVWRRFGGGKDQSFLAKVPAPSQVGHFFGLQRPSFSNPHFSHFQTAITVSFQMKSLFITKLVMILSEKEFLSRKKGRSPVSASLSIGKNMTCLFGTHHWRPVSFSQLSGFRIKPQTLIKKQSFDRNSSANERDRQPNLFRYN